MRKRAGRAAREASVGWSRRRRAPTTPALSWRMRDGAATPRPGGLEAAVGATPESREKALWERVPIQATRLHVLATLATWLARVATWQRRAREAPTAPLRAWCAQRPASRIFRPRPRCRRLHRSSSRVGSTKAWCREGATSPRRHCRAPIRAFQCRRERICRTMGEHTMHRRSGRSRCHHQESLVGRSRRCHRPALSHCRYRRHRRRLPRRCFPRWYRDSADC